MIRRSILLLICTVGALAQETTRERTVIFGTDSQPWARFTFQNTQVKEGVHGTLITLRDRSGEGDQPGIDLFLSFEDPNVSLSHYRFETPPQITRQASRLGTAAGVFQEDPNGLVLQALPSSMFYPGNLWHDFKIEFWTYLPNLSEGASVLTWRGAYRRGREVTTQELRIGLKGRVMEFRAKNFFQMPMAGAPETIRIEGRRPMLPGRWTHHRFQFDSSTGLLEYFRDGIPENTVYVTTTGREGGQVYVPYIGELSRPVIHLGENLAALVDELRISRRLDSLFGSTATYDVAQGSPIGYAVSPIVDLGEQNFLLEEVSWEASIPTGTALSVQLRFGDRLDFAEGRAPRLVEPWMSWPAASKRALRGRYLQVRLRLDGDGSGEKSPQVERLRLRLSRIPEPIAPAFVSLRGGEELELSWRPVADEGVRSYRVFWGLHPNHFEPTRYFEVPQDFGRAFSWDNGERPRIRFRLSADRFREIGDEVAARAYESGRLLYFAVSAVKELDGVDGGKVFLLSPYSEMVSGRRVPE